MLLFSLKKRSSSFFLTLFFASTLLWYGCPNPPGGLDDELPDVPINPEHEQNPPIAKDVTFQILEQPVKQGNLLIEAEFEPNAIDGRFHALLVGQEKFVLRDDGKGGDKEEGDGIFSIIVKEDLEGMTKRLDELNAKNLEANEELRVFEGRTMRTVDRGQFKEFRPSILKDKRPALIPRDIFRLLTAADPALKDHSLMITDPAVVEDPDRTFTPCPIGTGTGTPGGVWTFGHLMREMANTPVTGVSPEAFMMDWLNTWGSPQTVNGDVIASRSNISDIINAWITLSGGTLDVDRAPFKLLAIVNRVDLRGASGYGVSDGGEGRFVFCAIDASCNVIRNPAPFMVIFEYGVPKKSCASLKAYAQEWFDLKTINPIGSTAYNIALENITKQFTEAGLGGSSAPNGSTLNQLRTNEFALGVSPWELREFNIDAGSNRLIPVTVKQEPITTWNRLQSPSNPAHVQLLADFVNANETAIEADPPRHSVPEIFSGTNMLAAKAHTLNPTNYHWDAGTTSGAANFINSDKARFNFSLSTCSGCHGGEANTGNFMHVAPSFSTVVPATLSGFLTGNPPMSASPFVVADRAGRTSIPASGWEFNDLERRAKDLEDFISTPCFRVFPSFDIFRILKEPPLVMTH